jgi:hypothetical protein
VTCRGISRDRSGLDLDELAIVGAKHGRALARGYFLAVLAVIVFIVNVRDARR